MDETLDRIAAALGVAALSDEEQTLLLECTRDVAHATQRRNAPLAAFLAGIAVADSPSRVHAVADAVRTIAEAVPPPEQPGPPQH